MKIKVGIVDEQPLLIRGFKDFINGFPDFEVVLEAASGNVLLDVLETTAVLPDILLVEVEMPGMDGLTVAKIVSQKYPSIRILVLTAVKIDHLLIEMIRAGCRGYLSKNFQPEELRMAMEEVYRTGSYNSDLFTRDYKRLLRDEREEKKLNINENERMFLQLLCKDYRYEEIAREMSKSIHTVDGYRKDLFRKLKVQSKAGLIVEAIRHHIISIDTTTKLKGLCHDDAEANQSKNHGF